MKLKTTLLALAAFSTLNLQLSTFAQGSLTPPAGAPAPVMKSLDQIEARTAITNKASLVTISQPGSYYLTGNLTVTTGNGIDITTNGVTLDLNGFTIRSTAPSATGHGIIILSAKNILIKNGFIQGGVTNNGSGVYGGGGFNYGIYNPGIDSHNVAVVNVSVSGCWNAGIYLGVGSGRQYLVDSCLVRTVALDGIIASGVTRCFVSDAGARGIYCERASDSHGESTSDISYHVGLTADNTAVNSTGRAKAGTGLKAVCAINCEGISMSGVGLSARTANNCSGYRSYGTAIEATVANGCYAISGTNLITYKYNMP